MTMREGSRFGRPRAQEKRRPPLAATQTKRRLVREAASGGRLQDRLCRCRLSRDPRRLTLGFEHLSHVAELLVAPLDEVLDLEAPQLAERLGNVLFEVVGSGVRIAVGAAERLGD